MNLSPDVLWSSADDRLRGGFENTGTLPADLRGLNIRLSEVQILDIKRGFLGGEDADIYPLFLVASPQTEEPLAVPALAVFNDIRAGQRLPLSQVAAPTIFRAGQAPPWIDVHVLVMKSKQRQRDLAAGIASALESAEGKAITTAILTSLATANPAAGVVGNLAVGLLNLVVRTLSQDKDVQLFYSRASIERADGYCIGRPIQLTDGRHAKVELTVQSA